MQEIRIQKMDISANNTFNSAVKSNRVVTNNVITVPNSISL